MTLADIGSLGAVVGVLGLMITLMRVLTVRVQRGEDRAAADRLAVDEEIRRVWSALRDQQLDQQRFREDAVRQMVTKQDLSETENRLMRALGRPIGG